MSPYGFLNIFFFSFLQVFIRLHKLVPNFRDKVIAISGDCSKTNMGLSDSDYELLTNKIHVYFHGAATVRFDEKLKLAANINVRGVIEMLKFARKCKSLKVCEIKIYQLLTWQQQRQQR